MADNRDEPDLPELKALVQKNTRAVDKFRALVESMQAVLTRRSEPKKRKKDKSANRLEDSAG